MRALFIDDIDDAVIMDSILINRASYPQGWASQEDEDYYQVAIRAKNNILIMLKDNEMNVGFLLAIPHDEAVRELVRDDPGMEQNPSCYYIENIAIIPAYRGKGGLIKMLEILKFQLARKGSFTLSMHARVSNNLSENIQKNMKVIEVRRINSWKHYNFQEPTDYIIVTWSSDKKKF